MNDLVRSMQKSSILCMGMQWSLQCHANPAAKTESCEEDGSLFAVRDGIFTCQEQGLVMMMEILSLWPIFLVYCGVFYTAGEAKNPDSGFVVEYASYAHMPLCCQSCENVVLTLQILDHGGQF